MTDPFASWKMMQDQMLATQKAQIEAATRIMGMGTNFTGAADAARKVAEANAKAWEAWMSTWTHKG
jgi:hypothetical protein